MDPFENKMNQSLQKLATDIIPSDELLTKAKICADNVFKLIQQKSHYKVGRVCIAGSAGKKTTIMGSDIDGVLFINNELPLFEDVLDEWKDILSMTDSYQIRDERKTKYSVQFKAFDFEFDILPAVNFTVGIQADRDTLIDIQQERVLAHIAKDPKKYGYSYSSSLADASIRFMERQNGFVNEMVRIAKFWYKTLHFKDYVSGAKSCVELVAVYAANQEEQNMGTKSHLRCFDRFIKYVQNFGQLNIHFGNEHQALDKNQPRVIDPVNPYNNLASNWDLNSIELIKNYAGETKRRLDFLASCRLDRLDLLFVPQPVFQYQCPYLKNIFGNDPQKDSWLVGLTESVSLLPDLKIRNERFGTDYKLRNDLEVLKLNLQIAICTAPAFSFDENQIKEVVKNMLGTQVYGKKLDWVPAADGKHEDYDITFTLPVSNQKSIRISYGL